MKHTGVVLLVCIAVGLLLTLCDLFFHVHFGVLAYSHPVFFGQAWWVFPNFIGAALGMYLGAKALFADVMPVPTRGELAFSLAWFVIAYAASGVGVDQPSLLLAGFLVAWGLRLVVLRVDSNRHRIRAAVYGVVLAVVGILMEGGGYLAGTFAYRDQQVFHVPWWLAGLYMNGSFVVLQVVRLVEARPGLRDDIQVPDDRSRIRDTV